MEKIDVKNAFFRPQVVIFDKDGTLVCFHTMWNSWCEDLVSRMNLMTERNLSDSVFNLIGYDKYEKKVKMGILAEETHENIKIELQKLLLKEGFSEIEADDIVSKTWQDTPQNLQIKTTGDLKILFQRLRENDIKIAICTSDSREGTEQFLEREDLIQSIDMILCGDDVKSISKPNPHNARYICETLDVCLSKAIMVGDTPADTKMGQAANLGLTIGVLTGIGTQADLIHADIIVEDVTKVVDLITPVMNENKQWHSVQVTTQGLMKIAEKRSFIIKKE